MTKQEFIKQLPMKILTKWNHLTKKAFAKQLQMVIVINKLLLHTISLKRNTMVLSISFYGFMLFSALSLGFCLLLT